MSKIYFISDAHLGDGQEIPERMSNLLGFLASLEAGSELFLLGDLFDVWFEYRTVIPKSYFDLLFALKRCADRRIKIHFIAGNHDFWMMDFFKTSLGMNLYPDIADLTLQGRRCYIAHGDGKAVSHISYRILRFILRNPVNVTLYRLLHPDLGLPLAGAFSRWSRKNSNCRQYDEEYIDLAKRKFNNGYDLVILGHTHRPQEYRENERTYVNVGDWMRTFTYGKLESGKLTLEHWITGGKDAGNSNE